MKNLVFFAIAFSFFTRIECSAQQKLEPVLGYGVHTPSEMSSVAFSGSAKGNQIMSFFQSFGGDVSETFQNLRRVDTTLHAGTYMNSGWNPVTDNIDPVLGKEYTGPIYVFDDQQGTHLGYKECCGNLLWSLVPNQSSTPQGNPSYSIPTAAGTTINLTVNCSGCGQQQQQQDVYEYRAPTVVHDLSSPEVYVYQAPMVMNYSQPCYTQPYCQPQYRQPYYGHPNYRQERNYYRAPRNYGGPGGAPGNGPGGTPGNGPGNSNGGPGGAGGNGPRR